ncbi:MAG: AAA+ family ATPase, partial [Gemmatimonadaceae bacterium]|nr:AAA+ family ATPase [Gemmatimonadaceae bacterium]
VTKLAADRAEQLKRSPDKSAHELEERLRLDLRRLGDFTRIHPVPKSGADVPDDHDSRLVVLSDEYPYSADADNAAFKAAKAILESRGNTPRLFRNTLVFLAPDKVRLQDLDEAIRKYLAWDSIVREKEQLDLTPYQQKQAEIQKKAADSTVVARLPEAYQWLIIPEQLKPQDPVTWRAAKLTGSDALAARASKKLRSEETLIAALGSTVLRKHMDDVPLWRGDHVEVRQLVDDFARYLYLPRIAAPHVLVHAIRDGLALLTWETDTFAFAESFDEGAARYKGLRGGRQELSVSSDGAGLLVKPAIARVQLDREVSPASPPKPTPPGGSDTPTGPVAGGGQGSASEKPVLRRFYGTVTLDSARAGRDAGRIAEEVIAHLAGLVGADVTVTLEISASVPSGVPEGVVRIVTENSRTLKFSSHGFESE